MIYTQLRAGWADIRVRMIESPIIHNCHINVSRRCARSQDERLTLSAPFIEPRATIRRDKWRSDKRQAALRRNKAHAESRTKARRERCALVQPDLEATHVARSPNIRTFALRSRSLSLATLGHSPSILPFHTCAIALSPRSNLPGKFIARLIYYVRQAQMGKLTRHFVNISSRRTDDLTILMKVTFLNSLRLALGSDRRM